jgi:hypothetical protein
MIHSWPLRAPAARGGSSDRRSLDTVLFASPDVRVGAFRCPADHPDFRTAGPIGGYSVVFPRTAVWIQHSDQRPFVADPTVATIYNLGQPYQRFRLSTEGDRADWFSVSSRLARGIVGGIVRHPDPLRPFGVSVGPVPAKLYYRQRVMFSRIASGHLRDPFEIEHEVTRLLAAILELAIPCPAAARPMSTCRHGALVERARAELASDPFGRSTVQRIAERVGASPYHLCRVFRPHRAHAVPLSARASSTARAGAARIDRGEPEPGGARHRLLESQPLHRGIPAAGRSHAVGRPADAPAARVRPRGGGLSSLSAF